MKTYIIFFAVPFDSATIDLYERVRNRIKAMYPDVTTVIGTKQVGPSPSYSDIATFKAQNTELNSQFVDQIRAADIVVADLTHNNPNVHVELGIALSQNKNILRVTGRDTKELGFDIQNLDVARYRSETELEDRILRYLVTFFEIKQLPISPQYPSLYSENNTQISLDAQHPGYIDFNSDALLNTILRDGRIEIAFEITQSLGTDNWFGVYIRVGTHPLLGSNLIYARPDGALTIVSYPGQVVIEHTQGNVPISGRKTLKIEFENNYLDARIDNTQVTTQRLSHQTFGGVWLGAWSASANVYSIKMICRDTIDLNPLWSP